jgi:hypothetical protein
MSGTPGNEPAEEGINADKEAEESSAPSTPAVEIDDIDRDSLHILPLSIIPFENKAIQRAKLIKNARLESVVELFRGKQMGSGQMDVGQVENEFGRSAGPGFYNDMSILDKLARLHSYDVYSLRILLRDQGIEIKDINALKLSKARTRELTSYMKEFTRPLIMRIYGSGDVSIQSFADVIALFQHPDVKKARKKLDVMAETLGITITELPKFLEDYGDIFLSLSYYKNCLGAIEPTIDDFIYSMREIQKNPQLKGNRILIETCASMERTITNLMLGIAGRFEDFDRSTRDMWNNISADSFRKVEALIMSYHTVIGGVLCSLSVKMDAWKELFPNPHRGGLMRRAEFIMTDMKQGMENIQKIRDMDPMMAQLQKD